jgi:hypothetical protein
MDAPGRTPGAIVLDGRELLADSETLDQGAVTIEVLLLDVVEQSTPPTDQPEKSSTAVMILGVPLEMLGELFDPAGQQCNLDFR